MSAERGAAVREEVEIFDTTLRDGCQLEGVSVTVEDKLRIAEQLDVLGVHYIEGGWPGANPKDEEFVRRAATELRLTTSTLVAFGSTLLAFLTVERTPESARDVDPLGAEVEIEPVRTDRDVAGVRLQAMRAQDLQEAPLALRAGQLDSTLGIEEAPERSRACPVGMGRQGRAQFLVLYEALDPGLVKGARYDEKR